MPFRHTPQGTGSSMNLGANYSEQAVISTPTNPSTDDKIRSYPKRIDVNNVGYFIKMEKAGSIVEVQVA